MMDSESTATDYFPKAGEHTPVLPYVNDDPFITEKTGRMGSETQPSKGSIL
jgi:hypothetical protein